jgi:hypothetical protein
MHQLKLMIFPTERRTLLVARDQSGAVLLKARLPPTPWHALALPRLLEGLGSFVSLRAALVVPEKAPVFATRLYPGWLTDMGGSHYGLQVIGSGYRERHDWWESPIEGPQRDLPSGGPR